jgi:hypothetical protein
MWMLRSLCIAERQQGKQFRVLIMLGGGAAVAKVGIMEA